MGKPENEIEKYLKKKAEKAGFLCLKFTSPGNRGVPDRILIGHGHTVFIELKRPGAATRSSQNYMINKIRQHGGIAVTIDTKQKVETLLQSLLSENGSYEPSTEKIRRKKSDYIGKDKPIIKNNKKGEKG